MSTSKLISSDVAVFYIPRGYDPLTLSPPVELTLPKKRACQPLRDAAIGTHIVKFSVQMVTSEVRSMTQRSGFGFGS